MKLINCVCLAILLCTLTLCGCAPANTPTPAPAASATPISATTQSPSPMPAPTATPAPTRNPEHLLQSQPGAYYAILQWFFRDGVDSGLHADATYLALDISGALVEDREGLIALFELFCEHYGYTPLVDTFDGLIEKGYIKDMLFEEGVLISFSDTLCTETHLETSAHEWLGDLAAVGANFVVKKNDGRWEIAGTPASWIS